jgi:hypothetical protein
MIDLALILAFVITMGVVAPNIPQILAALRG